MKIALLGAPGSGKSKIARKAQSLLGKDKWGIVDGYVDQISKQTGIQFGVDTNFSHNLAVITNRWIKEAELLRQGKNSITCGSIYESILYSTYNTMHTSPEEDQILRENYFNQIMFQALGALEKTSYDYDAIYFIPLMGKAKEQAEGTWDQVIDAKILEVLEAFSKVSILLNQKTDKSKAERVVEVIGVINEYRKTQSNIATDDE